MTIPMNTPMENRQDQAEAARLSALYRYRILDTPPDQGFDDLVKMVAELLGAPIAAVNLIDRDRQWFKAEVGLGVREMPLDDSICKFALLEQEGMVVPDTTTDPRFACNPLVTGAPGLRFYAGELLKTPDGHPLGSLCVLDTVARPDGLSLHQHAILKTMALQVMKQLELHRLLSQQRETLQERARVEEALRLERDRGQQLLDGMSEGFVLLDAQFRVQQINAGAMRMERRERSEILGRSHWEAWPGSEHLPVAAAYRRAMRDRVPVDLEQCYVYPDGRSYWMDVRAYPVDDGLAVFYRNVNERREAEIAIHESRERFEKVVSQAATGVVQIDVAGRFTHVNQKFGEMLGYDPQQLVGNRIIDVTAPVSVGDTLAALEQVLAGAAGVSIEKQYRRRDGSMIWAKSSINALRDADGRIQGLVAIVVDMTEQKQVEAALRESEAKFRIIADAMPQMVWSTRADGYHDYYNQRWYDYTGMPPGSTDGEGWSELFHPEDQPRAWETWRRSLATGTPYEIHYRLRHRSGIYRWTLGRALPVRDDAGTVIRWMGTCTDIHDQKLAEEELLATNRRKDEFLAMLAHELRNPLAPISTAAQLLRIAAADPQRVRHSSEIIARQVKHMTELVDDLLDVSRVTRGLVTLDRETIDIKTVVGNAVEQAKPVIEARDHALNIRMTSAPATVHGDRKRLTQVVVNLLNNAAKYTPPGGEITLAVQVQDGDALVCVSDNGMGIDPPLIPQLFELFTQAERTPDRSQGGLGLGLALVKSIVALHGGSVAGRSEGPGTGSTFTVSLPIAQADPASVDEPGDAAGLRRARAVNFMIVDDNLDAARSLAMLLEAEGHTVAVESDARHAIAAAARQAPDVFILDIGLPDMNGYELAMHLRAQPHTGRCMFIALTGYGQEQDRQLSSAAGFDHHFVKPMDLAQLSMAMDMLD